MAKCIEELGHYDPLVKDTDARAILKGERIAYWLSVGAQPSENCHVLIKKYGQNGTHMAAAAGGPGADQDDPPAGPRAVRAAAQAAGTGTGRPKPPAPAERRPRPQPSSRRQKNRRRGMTQAKPRNDSG